MKTLGGLMAGAAVAICALVPKAEACSIMPVDTARQALDMQRFVATALKIDPAGITSVEVSDASGDYIWTDPMCPEGLTASATFTVTFKKPKEPLASRCLAEVQISKTEPTGLSKIPVKHSIHIEITQEKCKG
ncbi:MAG TPA: hypothetical protein VE954_20035 [Oligoflexus sp.]|uniref:hypothetical protein n=1 Tax=Oligoflexus sp. TaxID=1971216 RepID=UPI002D310181|nr:hypothetical protein [Oligoflexus sp.]HYX35392.1 hypothetical protein [Oligoflexus sp.]